MAGHHQTEGAPASAPENVHVNELQRLNFNKRQGMLSLCLITSDKPKVVTKQFSLVNNELRRETSASVYDGQCELITLANMTEFAGFLKSLGTNQCLTFGVPPVQKARLVTEGKWCELGKPKDAVPRTQSVYTWPKGGGVLVLDYDAPKDGSDALTQDKLFDAMTKAIPTFMDHPFVWWPSASSCIYQGDKQHRGLMGQRIYLHVANAQDIPRAGQALTERLWALGYGHFEVSKSGSLLERGLFDTSVWQTNRIDFAAGAMCGEGLDQRRGEPYVNKGDTEPMNTALIIPGTTSDEQAQADRRKNEQRQQVKWLASEARESWVEARASDLQQNCRLESEQARQVAKRAVENQTLSKYWEIKVRHGEQTAKVTVGEILANPEQYHEAICRDPIEPDYDGGRWVGILYVMSQRPVLHSMAHGGATYALIQSTTPIEVVFGQMRDAIDELLEVMQNSLIMFDLGDELVHVGPDGAMQVLNEHGLSYHLPELIQFYRRKDTKLILLDPPSQVCKQVLSIGASRKLRRLVARITTPTLRRDGSVLREAGYDAQEELLLAAQSELVPVPEHPTLEQAREALATLWAPFRDFPFVGAIDRGVHLAALLTAAVRATLPATPIFGYDAPAQGSGKTLLAQCVAVLAAGEDHTLLPPINNDQEMSKTLFSLLREGKRACVIDNLVGTFDSTALASMVTSSVFTSRILGVSNTSTVPNRLLVMITGTNLTLAGEMPRRVLKCRVDPQTARPFDRVFDCNPLEVCKVSRQQLIAAALTLIRARLSHHPKALGAGAMSSFEPWDAWVRQTVLFANSLCAQGVKDPEDLMFGDVLESVSQNMAYDPETELLGELLELWHKELSDQWMPTGAILNAAEKPTSSVSGEADSLQDCLLALMPGRQSLNSRSLGKVLGYRVDRIVGNKRLVCWHDTAKNSKLWRVECVAPETEVKQAA